MRPQHDPPTLADAVDLFSYDRLRRIGAFLQLDLPPQARNRKAAWRNALLAHWQNPDKRARALAGLGSHALQAVQRLGRTTSLPRHLFAAEFGGLRPLPQLQRPYSPAEELALTGLLIGWRRGTLLAELTLADRVTLVQLPDLMHSSQHADVMPAPRSPLPPFTFLHDLAQLLILRATKPDPPLLHTRWLVPTDLRTLASTCRPPRELMGRITHKRAPYFRDLMFWAQLAGLLSHGRVSAIGWAWLRLPPLDQLHYLWDAWFANLHDEFPQTDMRHAFMQPDAGWPHALRQALLDICAAHTSAFTPQQIADALLTDTQLPLALFPAHFADLTAVDTAVEHLLSGPLTQLGIVYTVNDSPATPLLYSVTPMARQRLEIAYVAPAVTATHKTSRSFTTWPPAHATSIAFDGTPTQSWSLDIPVCAPPWLHAAVALFAVRGPAVTGWRHRYHLQRTSVAQAAARGHAIGLLFSLFSELGYPLDPAHTALIWRWWLDGRALQLQNLPILRTTDAERFTRLMQDPAASTLVESVLGPTSAILNRDPAAAAAALEEAGYLPVKPAEHVPDRPQITDAGALWMAGQVYLMLGEFLPVPLPMDEAILASLHAPLRRPEQALLQTHLLRTREMLLTLLDDLPFVPPPTPSDPTQWQAQLDAAIADANLLTITYHSAGRNVTARRRVTPLWREARRDIPYVRVQCAETGAVLSFRLDRIMAIEDAAPSTK